jgi:hypothetical protein
MKATVKYNKSEIMKQAWWLFRNVAAMSFSQCLKNAWAQAKGVNMIADRLRTEKVNDLYFYLTSDFNQHAIIKDEILETVAEKSNGFQADIAKKAIENDRISVKQAWCVAYEYKKVA